MRPASTATRTTTITEVRGTVGVDRPKADTRTGGHGGRSRSVVLELDGLQWATQRNVVEARLGRRPGVVAVDANPVAQTATVTYDPIVTTVEDIAGWVRECGYHCRGESVPDHVCGPDAVAGPVEPVPAVKPTEHAGHDMSAMGDMGPAPAPGVRTGSPSEVMGHGGRGEMSMASMTRDMRNRFLVAVGFGVVITLWSMIGREVLNFSVPAPFGLRCHPGTPSPCMAQLSSPS